MYPGAAGERNRATGRRADCLGQRLPASAVSVHIPPQSGSYAGKAGYVEVAIDTSLEASFSRAISGESLGVTAWAVARGAPMDIGIILLRGSGAGAFQCWPRWPKEGPT